MGHLALALLGPFRATMDGLQIDGLTSPRLRALLAYLAVGREQEHLREQVASLLWPEWPDREAVASLRSALSKLRTALGDRRAPFPFLLISRTTVGLNSASDHWLDVAEFECLAGRQDVPSLEQAASLYRGPFLHGLSVADSPAFDDWLLQKNEEYQRGMLSVLRRLAHLQIDRGAYAEAASWARRQLELEPYREQAHRQLMLALALGGERSGALAQYEACRRLLAKELGCEPEDETQALYAQIRAGPLPLSASSPPHISVSTPPPASAHTQPSPLLLPARDSPPGQPGDSLRFVAREQEMARLGTLLDQALTCRGGVALIAGEAGSGKTALMDEFARRAGLAHGDLIALRGSCNAHGGTGDPYLPFREILQTLTGDLEGKRAGGALSREQTRRAWEALPAVGAALVEHGSDLIDTFVPGELLLERIEGFRKPVGAVRWRVALRTIVRRNQKGPAPTLQADLFAQVTQVLHAVSVQRPLLLTVDDLQWADGGTVALLFHLGRRLAGSRILLACAYRPEALQASPDDRGPGQAADLGLVLHELAREWGDVLVDLDEADGRSFVEAYVDSEPNRLGSAFRQALYSHTGGNPLFTVELLHSFERRGALVRDEAGRWIEAPGLDWGHVPARVEAVIAGHLSSLPDEDWALLRAASVQGERFAAEIAARVLGWDEEALVRHLSGPLRTRHRLIEAVSLERLPSGGQRLSTYRFRHGLLQRGAYNSLDAMERAWLHETTARTLEDFYAAERDPPLTLAPELARHYEAAGMRLEAARALHDAGRQAMQLSAFRQALSLFDRGLALLAGEPPSPERKEIQRLLEVARLGPQRNIDGPGRARLVSDLARVTETGVGEAQGRPALTVLWAQAERLFATGQYSEGLAVAERLRTQATQWSEKAFVALAHWRFGTLYHAMGNFWEAENHFDRALDEFTPQAAAEARAAVGLDLAAATLSFSAMDQWLLGYPERALARSAQALTGAIEEGDAYGQAFASAMASILLFLLRDGTALGERAELCHRVCLEKGFAMWQSYAQVFIGWLAVVHGEDLAGIERMWSAVAGWQAKGMAVGMDSLVLVLADGCLVAADQCPTDADEERTRLLAMGLAAVEAWIGSEVACGQAYQAELHRVRGELLLARDGLAAAEEALACFRQAEQIGREQGALVWELRAATSLVRLRHSLRSHGETRAAELAEARQCLRDVYGRFTEGFAFPDLQDAAALLGTSPPGELAKHARSQLHQRS